ncbi:MAG: toxin-antitoxin system YwqK family antitoxin, partial [Thermonemataceae bacterium]|nr:toxin-antitoxin system YwqK family antitoxin [Thermonemataceae bacterium]
MSFKKIIALHLLLTLLSSTSLAQLKVVKVFYDEEEKQLKEAYEMDLGDNGWEKTGYYKSYFKSGRLALEGNFKQNKPNGWFKEYYDTTFSKKTPLKSQVFYENGLKNGKMWALNMQGDTIQKANFKDNQLEGDFLSYYPNGKIFRKSFFKDTNVEGLAEEFYESGKIAKKMYFKNGQIDSICAYYYESGNIKAKEFYKNGLLNGLQSTYYDANSSHIQSNYFMRNNVKIGKEEIFAENGNLVQVAFYENGLLEGDYKQWYADTKRLKYEANYQKGYKNGKEILYFNTEKPII